MGRLKKPGAEKGWHLLTGTDDIHKVADSIGFKYAFDKKRDLYNHPAGLIILTPEGRTSRYMYGTGYEHEQFALMDASNGRIGSFVEKLTICDYDPTQGRYGLIIIRVVQFTGICTLLVLGFHISDVQVESGGVMDWQRNLMNPHWACRAL